MKMTGKTETGREITDLKTWYKHAPPAKKDAHWKDYRSAKELAQAWCRKREVRCPSELLDLLSKRAVLADYKIEQAVAEMQIKFDQYPGGRRNADLALWGKSKKNRIVITVEAKADESAGTTVKQKLKEGAKNTKSNIPKRVAQLSHGIMNREVDASIESLHYQLYPALAATASLARDKQAKFGVLIIHEFLSLTVDIDKVINNANALNSFIRLIPKWGNQTLKSGDMLPFIKLPGSESVPSDIYVSIGKIQTLIPLGARGRRHTTDAKQLFFSEG